MLSGVSYWPSDGTPGATRCGVVQAELASVPGDVARWPEPSGGETIAGYDARRNLLDSQREIDQIGVAPTYRRCLTELRHNQAAWSPRDLLPPKLRLG